jgi:hypothetical protein
LVRKTADLRIAEKRKLSDSDSPFVVQFLLTQIEAELPQTTDSEIAEAACASPVRQIDALR